MKLALMFAGLVLLLFLWLIADFKLGRKKHLSMVSLKERPMLLGSLDIFINGKELFSDYFRELEDAKKHIHVLFYIVKDDEFSMRFVSLLQKKALNGVEVRLLVDRIGGYKMTKKIIRQLRESGVHFSFGNSPKPPFLLYSSQVRNHRKITIIDGKIGYVGGYNVGKEYIDEDPVLNPWRDYHLKITGAVVPFLQREFLNDWKGDVHENLLDQASYFPPLTEGEIRLQLGGTEAGLLESIYTGMIKNAKKTLIIGSPYFIPSKKVMYELVRAAQRGVEITILVPLHADHMLVQEASYRYLRRLLKEGAHVFQYRNGFYHAKTVLVDDTVCDIGTANFDKRSIFLNKEINCFIYDQPFIQRIKTILETDIRDSTPLTLQKLNERHFFRSIKENLAGAISYFL
ncbi:MAG: cardiolipin synthase [Bacillota bacterium]|nr:cardiolipin synthase [Bacillota bacterium]